jgi:chaperonin GroES
MRILPLHDRVLARREIEDAMTSGGLFIPDNAREKPLAATIVAVGGGKLLDNGTTQRLVVKAGDKVLIGKYTGSDVQLDGDDHIILREDEILAVLDS